MAITNGLVPWLVPNLQEYVTIICYNYCTFLKWPETPGPCPSKYYFTIKYYLALL